MFFGKVVFAVIELSLVFAAVIAVEESKFIIVALAARLPFSLSCHFYSDATPAVSMYDLA